MLICYAGSAQLETNPCDKETVALPYLTLALTAGIVYLASSHRCYPKYYYASMTLVEATG